MVEVQQRAQEAVQALLTGAETFGRLRQEAEALGPWLQLGQAFAQMSEEQWQRVATVVVEKLLAGVYHWSQAQGRDPRRALAAEGQSARLLLWSQVSLGEVLATAWLMVQKIAGREAEANALTAGKGAVTGV